MKISLAMIVRNEAKYIERCLKSVDGLVDEIVIVDTGSTDDTVEILKNYRNVSLYQFEWCNDFSIARNFSIDRTKGDYILVLDADEYIIEGNREELELTMAQNVIGKVLIQSRFKKNNYTYTSKDYVSRFFSRNIRYIGAIHEQIDSNLPRRNLKFSLIHDGYYGKKKSERNIPLLLNELSKNPTDPYYLFQLGKEYRINNSYNEAFNYLKRSYENLEINSPYYPEVVIELINSGKESGNEEVLDIITANEKRLKNIPDFHFAKGLFYLDYCLINPQKSIGHIKKIESSFLACINLNGTGNFEYVYGVSSFLATYNLGVYYEVTGNIQKAVEYYNMSLSGGNKLAGERLKELVI